MMSCLVRELLDPGTRELVAKMPATEAQKGHRIRGK